VLHAQAFVGAYAGISLAGPVTAIDAENRTVWVAGIPVDVNSETVLRQSEDATLRSIGFADITVGNQAQVLAEAVSGRSRVSAFRLVQGGVSQSVSLRELTRTTFELQPPMFQVPVGDRASSIKLVVEADANTKFYRGLLTIQPPKEVSADDFWNGDPSWTFSASVFGRWTGDHVLADEVIWIEDL
jgi:hypothetical protein